MTSTSRVDPRLEKNTTEMLKREGIISQNEQLETIYLADDEIEQFMAKYLRENPGTEVETRYINHPPIELTQNIEVRWLRPETPEIPPIIIKEIEDPNATQPPPLRIVQKSRAPPQPDEPIVIRERPPMTTIPEPKYAYVQNVIKRQAPTGTGTTTATSTGVTKTNTNSESTIGPSRAGVGAAVARSRLDFDEQRSERDTMNYSYEEHGGSIVDYEEDDFEDARRSTMTRDNDELSEDKFPPTSHRVRQPRTYEDEHQLRLYEEKLKRTLYEEYLLRLERERLERKLSKSGLLEERIRERSISQDRLSHQHMRDEEHKYRAREPQGEMRHHIIRERNTQSLEKDNQIMQSASVTSSQQQGPNPSASLHYQPPTLPPPIQQTAQQQLNQKLNLQSISHTSSYKNIKFTRVTDRTDLERLNSILNNPQSPVLDSKDQAKKIAETLVNSELAAEPTPAAPVMIRIRPNKNTSSDNISNSSEASEIYYAIIRADSAKSSHVMKPFDKIQADGIANINDLASETNPDRTTKKPITNNLMRDNSNITSARQILDSDAYYQLSYPKPPKYGDFVVYDPKADYDSHFSRPGHSMPVYYKPLSFQSNHVTPESNVNKIHANLNNPININANDKNIIYFSTRY